MDYRSNIEDKTEDMMIVGDVVETVKLFYKQTFIVWHDQNINPAQNLMIEEAKEITDVKLFTDYIDVLTYLKGPDAVPCQLVTTGTDSELLIKEICKISHIFSIHVFCNDVDTNKKWANQYPTIVSVTNDFKSLKENLKQCIIEWQKKPTSLKDNLPVYVPIFNDMDRSEHMYLHFYLKGFVNFVDRKQSKKDFLRLARGLYGKTKHIEKFERDYHDYDMAEILKWYTKESFFYKITNNCLRIANTDSIQYCRFALRDLQIAIKDKYEKQSKSFNGLLYRGAFISNDEWTKLCKNVGKDLEMHGFLSTSKDKNIALTFIKGATGKKALITIIVPPAPEKDEQGFAEVKEYSAFKDEDEIIFNVMSRFTVLQAVIEEVEGNKCRHLVLLYGAQAMRKYMITNNPSTLVLAQSITKCHLCCQEISILKTMVFVNLLKENECICAGCLKQYQANNKDPLLCLSSSVSTSPNLTLKVEGFPMRFNNDLSLPFYGTWCRKCKLERPGSCVKCINCQGAGVLYCEKCLVDSNSCVERKHLLVLESYPFSFWSEKMSERELLYLKHYQQELEFQKSGFFKQAQILYQSHNYRKVVEYYLKLMDQDEITDDKAKGYSYHQLGNAYDNLGQYQNAIDAYSKALEIRKRIFGDNNSDTAMTYNALGSACFNLGEYRQAIGYYLTALEGQRAVLGEKDPDTASTYDNIGNAYQSLEEFQTAIEFTSRALKIRKEIFGKKSLATALSYNNLAAININLGEYEKAIKLESKALEIRKALLGDKHPDTAWSYTLKGTACLYLGQADEAIELQLKGLEIRKAVLGERHPSTASSFNSLACAYYQLEEYDKALEFGLKALEIQRAVFGEEHQETAVSYINLGNTYYGLQEYDKAIDCFNKALDIYKQILGDRNSKAASAYNNLGTIYDELGEYEKAVESFLKALDIQEAILGTKHNFTATTYDNLGSAYHSLGEYEKGTEFYLKAIESKKATFGEKSLEVASCYINLGYLHINLEAYDKVVEYYGKGLELQREVLGEEHPKTASSYNNIGIAYFHLNEYKKAMEACSKALEIRKKVLGDEHQDTVKTNKFIEKIRQDLEGKMENM